MSDMTNAERFRLGALAALEQQNAALLARWIVRLGAYTRISDDQEDAGTGDRGAGVERQFESVTALCKATETDRLLAQIVGRYEDNDVSAFKDVPRPEFERLLSDLEDGRIDGIIVYDLDRLCRRPRDLERVIDIYDAAAKAGRKLYFRTVHDAIDLASPDGITMARVLVAFANKASRDTARRVAAKHLKTALTGRPVSGTRPFGWDYTRDAVVLSDGREIPEVTEPGRKGNQVINVEEAHELRRVVADLLGGVSLNSVVNDLNSRGIKTSRGNAWSAATLKQLLVAPRMAGLRVHQGELLIHDETKEFVRGLWDPVVTPEVWMALSELLGARDGRNSGRRRESHRDYMLSGILRCVECTGPLHGNARNEKHFYYACKTRGGGPDSSGGCGKVSVSGVAVDELVSDLIKARMLTLKPTPDDEGDVEGRLQEAREQISAYTAALGNLKVGTEALAKVTADLRNTQEVADGLLRLRNQRLVMAQRAERQRRIGPDSWDSLPVAEKRAYVRLEVDAIYASRATKKGNRFDPERLRVVWRTQPGAADPAVSTAQGSSAVL